MVLLLVFVAATLLPGVTPTVAAFGLVTAAEETVGLTTNVLLALTGGTDDDATVVPARPDEALEMLAPVPETVAGTVSEPVVAPTVAPTLVTPVAAVVPAVVTGTATKPPVSPITAWLGPEETDEFTVDCGLAMMAGLTNCPVGCRFNGALLRSGSAGPRY